MLHCDVVTFARIMIFNPLDTLALILLAMTAVIITLHVEIW